MKKENITITMKWKLKRKIPYSSFPVEIQRETEKAICVNTTEDCQEFYAGWIPKRAVLKRVSLS